MTTTRKLTIAAVALLVCGIVVALVVWPRPDLVLTLQALETNEQGSVFARVVVSNASQHRLSWFIGSQTNDTALVDNLAPDAVIALYIFLPRQRPCRIYAVSRRAPRTALERARFYFDRKVRKREWSGTGYTLDIP